jgi:hypothetical protein
MNERLIAQVNNLSLEIEQRMDGGSGQLSESMSDLDWANRIDRDFLWIRTSGANAPQFRYMTKETIDTYSDLANFMYVYNPLINRVVTVKTQFTFALDYSITAKDPESDIGAAIDMIKNDKLNRQAFFTHKAITEIDAELIRTGNVFIAVWKDETPVQIRAWSNYEIRNIITRENDANHPLYYLRSWLDDEGIQHTKAYPSMFAEKAGSASRTKIKYLGTEYEIDQSIVVYHVCGKKPLKAKFALTELVAACRWAKPHEKFIEDFHAIASAYRKYSHMMTTKGTATQASNIAGQFKGDTNYMGTPLQSNPVGSMIVAQEGNELRTISAGSGNIIGIEGARASLMQICAATGVPETYLTMDPSTGNLATAKEISPVFITMIQERQTGWRDALTDIFGFILDNEDFEVSFPPIRDNLVAYVANVNAFARTNTGGWSGAVRGKDYVKAAHEALEWKLPPEEEIDAMGAALESGAEPVEPDTQGMTDLAQAAHGLDATAKELEEAVRKVLEANDDGKWVTINGARVLLKDGESTADAFKRTTGKDLNDGGSSGGSGGRGSGDGGGSSSKGSSTSSDSKESDTQLVKALQKSSNKALGDKIAAEQEGNLGDHLAYGKTLADDAAINDYTAVGYGGMNAYLRGDITEDKAKNLQFPVKFKDVEKIDAAIAGAPALPEGTVLYRGVGERGVASLMNMKPGDSCNDKAFQSFSTSPNQANQFTTRASIEGEKGSHKVLIRAITSGKEKGLVIGGGEHEVIMPRGSGWKVVSNNAVTSGANAGRVTTHVITVVPV